jgi:hypothetical protein
MAVAAEKSMSGAMKSSTLSQMLDRELCGVRLAAPEPHGRCVGGRDESRKRVNKVKRSQQGLRLAAEVGCRQLNQVFPRAVL